MPALAAEAGLAAVSVKDETDRLGLPAFKVLGASWAVERALAAAPDVRTLVAASAGNHGRAVARVAALRGLRCRVLLPARSAGMDCAEVSSAAWPALRDGIAGTVLVEDGELPPATELLAANGLRVGECGAAPVAALRALANDPAAAPLRDALGLASGSRAVLVATEGITH